MSLVKQDEWEQARLRPPIEKEIDEWAEDSIVLPRSVSERHGPMRFDITPFIRTPLRAAADYRTRELTFCSSTQVMKTTIEVVSTLHALATRPGNILHVCPKKDAAAEMSIEVYQEIIRASPSLRKFLTGGKRQMNAKTIRINGGLLALANARSPTDLSRRTAGRINFDECDKYPDWTGSESDPISLAIERMQWYDDTIALYASTPTTPTRYIWPRLLRSSYERFFVPCPHCGFYQVLVMGGRDGPGIKFDSREDPGRIQTEQLAYYQCAECERKIVERQRMPMIEKGVWAGRDQKVDKRGRVRGPPLNPSHRGFHLWSAYSPMRNFSMIAAKFLQSQHDDRELMGFRNSWQGEPWIVKVNELKASVIVDNIADYKDGSAPKEAWSLTVGVDVQRRGATIYHYYVLRAWGPNAESWRTLAGVTTGWADLTRVLFDSQYYNAAGVHLPISCIAIDSHYETGQVMQYCEEFGCWIAFGVSHLNEPYKTSEIVVSPHLGIRTRKLSFQPDFYKTELHSRIRSGKWHVPGNVDREYLSQLTAEQPHIDIDKKTGRRREVWRVFPKGVPNHYGDCEVLCLVGMHLARIEHLNPVENQQPPQPIHLTERIFSKP